MAVVCHWPLYHMNVKNVFLNGDLQEEIYIPNPPRYAHSCNYVFRLQRTLYGIKQAFQAMFAKFSSVVTQQGFTLSPYNTILFICKSSVGV